MSFSSVLVYLLICCPSQAVVFLILVAAAEQLIQIKTLVPAPNRNHRIKYTADARDSKTCFHCAQKQFTCATPPAMSVHLLSRDVALHCNGATLTNAML